MSQPITWLNPYRHRPFSSWLDSIFINAKEKPWTKILHSKGIFHPSHAKAACYMESAHVQSRAPHHGLTAALIANLMTFLTWNASFWPRMEGLLASGPTTQRDMGFRRSHGRESRGTWKTRRAQIWGSRSAQTIAPIAILIEFSSENASFRPRMKGQKVCRWFGVAFRPLLHRAQPLFHGIRYSRRHLCAAFGPNPAYLRLVLNAASVYCGKRSKHTIISWIELSCVLKAQESRKCRVFGRNGPRSTNTRLLGAPSAVCDHRSATIGWHMVAFYCCVREHKAVTHGTAQPKPPLFRDTNGRMLVRRQCRPLTQIWISY